LRAELSRPRWQHEHVALGTNTDPYQWVEGRYELMRGIWAALAQLSAAGIRTGVLVAPLMPGIYDAPDQTRANRRQPPALPLPARLRRGCSRTAGSRRRTRPRRIRR
jgi:DNA repair photolyase